MTNKKPAQRATTSDPKPAETVGDVATQAPAGASASGDAGATTTETAANPAVAQPTTNADDNRAGATATPAAPGNEATSGTPAPPAADPKPAQAKPARKTPTKRKPLDPADDPTAGITGVPVDYVPTPAVP